MYWIIHKEEKKSNGKKLKRKDHGKKGKIGEFSSIDYNRMKTMPEEKDIDKDRNNLQDKELVPLNI